MDNYILYRKYKDFGWQIVGWKAAKEEGRLYFGTHGGGCRSGHDAPHMVTGRVCAKCFIIAKRRQIMLKMNEENYTKTQVREFWRKHLNLPFPDEDCGRAAYVYIVDNFPYTNLKEAAKFTGITSSVIRYRCESDDFLDFVSIATK